jgi:hypothetical protein
VSSLAYSIYGYIYCTLNVQFTKHYVQYTAAMDTTVELLEQRRFLRM